MIFPHGEACAFDESGGEACLCVLELLSFEILLMSHGIEHWKALKEANKTMVARGT